ncbi:hypothetical protein AB205_0035880 [Aquarana catesbeiana]|uniref:Uncharacterized protein n=1 Tax=Aquarana catesbeiana TaxID=8400 RepID=A0A2G9SEV1_AQUCT|nr:hypothetical protein AB205_0035880 [Aquarana catesbeiana]
MLCLLNQVRQFRQRSRRSFPDFPSKARDWGWECHQTQVSSWCKNPQPFHYVAIHFHGAWMRIRDHHPTNAWSDPQPGKTKLLLQTPSIYIL